MPLGATFDVQALAMAPAAVNYQQHLQHLDVARPPAEKQAGAKYTWSWPADDVIQLAGLMNSLRSGMHIKQTP
jgi:hypothetical protein